MSLFLVAAARDVRADPAPAADPARCDSKSIRATITDPEAYARVLHCSVKGGRPHVRGLMARVLKGKTDEDFTTLSDDPDRKIVFLMGSDGLESLVGLTNEQILAKIGYTADYVAGLQHDGYRFELVVFKSGSDAPKLATWDHVVALAATTYPDIAGKLEAALPRLKRTSFATIEKQAPTRFADVERAGRDHADYVDEQRLEKSDGALWRVRAFLYHRLRVTELYGGDGFTRTPDHKKGVKEYVTRNRPIHDLTGAQLIEL